MLSTFFKARKKRLDGEQGFTLIELLVVVVILGILIAIAIPVYLNYRKSANDRAAQSDLRGAIGTLEVCNTDAGYPTTIPTSGGAMTTTANGCTQTISKSDGTTFRYVTTPASATAGNVTSYTIYATNSNGSTKVYCYNSATGGGVKDATGTAMATATC